MVSAGICSIEYHRIKAWKEERPRKAGQYARITSCKLTSDASKKKGIGQKRQEACMDEQGALGQTQTQKGSLKRVEARTGSLGGIQRNCLSSQGSG